ncbi:FAD-dependent oxidoreductase [Paenibacillus selenitireducens]|uniref:FAD-dependent oxidoreductase n=2 Tax=Paenibacillus selenitireducens TaxID=1324314 RepID=A0A1T2XKZ3_9BACL|nr:FAD-dependent oxidoreductase [Paenibacillus selenitireducens]OPA80539.1 FAD-dependent oxidoreductase [Paenibacillus selenitireducens]
MEHVMKRDLIVIGGGLGGCMAALASAKMGFHVVLTEETDWLGGQLTSQAVPPDEHPWIERFGCTASYREFRDRVRAYYQANYPLTEDAKGNKLLNPGNGWVSRLCHEPKVAKRVLEDMMAPYIHSGRIRVLYQYRPVAAASDQDQVTSVTVESLVSGERHVLQGQYFIDATECGDVLPLAGVEFVMGAEGKSTTLEPHASEEANPLDMQAFTYVFALDYLEGEDHTIDKPENYEFWRDFVPRSSRFPLLSWYANDADDTTEFREFTLFPNDRGLMPLWTYRRIIDTSIFDTPLYDSDISLINWPQNDYFLGPIYGVPEDVRQHHIEQAKQLSLSVVYWLQTEAPRLDGGKGYPGLRLRKDVLDTTDGLAKHPYIRESRRIQAVHTITEHHVSKEIRGEQGIYRVDDSVGVGSYHLDLHLTTVTNRTFYIPTYPYEIPLGALLPIRVKNLLPACKNIGMTQITNGCYRLHPTEWNIGESVGYLAAFCMLHQISPHEVHADDAQLKAYQALLSKQGIEMHWPEHLEI